MIQSIMSEETKDKPKQDLFLTTAASALAGSLAKLILHPIDTVKAKYQVSTAQINIIQDFKKGTVYQIIKKTWANQGVPGFFRGVTLSCIGSAFAFSGYMTAYEFAKTRLTESRVFEGKESLCHLTAGFIAEVVSCSMWLPIDIIKERMQVQSELKLYSYDNARDAAQKIHKSQGIIGLYRAFGATLLSFGPFSALFFAFYQKLKKIVCKNPKEPTVTQNIFSSSVAGSVAAFVTTPLELAKLRMQIQRADKSSRGGNVRMEDTYFGYRNMFHGIYSIWKKEGFVALYRGAVLRAMFSAPMTTLSMTFTEVFKQKLRERRKRKH